MSDPTRQSTRFALTENDGLGSIDVDLEAYFEFHFEIAESLEDMVAYWQHRFGRKSRRRTKVTDLR